MSNRMTVHLEEKPIYDIVLEQSFDRLAKELSALGEMSMKKLCVVSDTTVANYYLKDVKECLTGVFRQIEVFVFPAGEASKNLQTVSQLYEFLIEKHFDRSDMLMALGGGVVGDLCGYAAATYLRGVDFIQIPTTLLSQVDSSIGGKTGVDFNSYKNMVGAFHMPKLVYVNLKTLLTLSNEQFSSGMGEVIKHGAIQQNDYYKWLQDNATAIKERNLDTCLMVVRGSNKIKKSVVEKDPREKGERALLNFGHTLGHAIEKLKGFELLHGHCVALGSLAAAYLSYMKGNLTQLEVEDYKETLLLFDLPVQCKGISAEQIIETSKLDKKMEHGTIKFILLNNIGNAYIDLKVTENEMTQSLSYILE